MAIVGENECITPGAAPEQEPVGGIQGGPGAVGALDPGLNGEVLQLQFKRVGNSDSANKAAQTEGLAHFSCSKPHGVEHSVIFAGFVQAVALGAPPTNQSGCGSLAVGLSRGFQAENE